MISIGFIVAVCLAMLYVDAPSFLTPAVLLKEAAVPGLLVFDFADEEIPPQLFVDMEQQWKQATIINTQSLGHNGIMKDVVIIQQVVDYLTVARV